MLGRSSVIFTQVYTSFLEKVNRIECYYEKIVNLKEYEILFFVSLSKTRKYFRFEI